VKAELIPYPSGMLLSLEKGKTVIGRNPDNDIVIEEPHVSHRHCVLRKNRGGFFIEDLSSSNGTYVNGSRVEGSIRLRNNDLITFGRELPAYRFRLHSVVS
jgi:pSer/pThr/pTyr-binding forkhead associated (FHA) protein